MVSLNDENQKATSERNVARGIVSREGKVLVAKAHHSPNYFLPGGGIRQGESAAAALIREIGEEIGMIAQRVTFMGVWENAWSRDGVRLLERNFVFVVDIPTIRQEVKSLEENLLFSWISSDNIEVNTIYPPLIEPVIKRGLD